ncbi:hypothetical protein P691DRAFT_805046 [Macrolepiota fuliginosa MF-IS2]|uniref:Uncharacterized protein n=1 Tax=Macrolepiota fuliginosa MF-IS2 TaxID=1400762 RepID=A0A9P6C207_9AGAR|nr:hypothetical protein P691DRAFT_805046 [Macrolepiota fuliginosa MF-IS2]
MNFAYNFHADPGVDPNSPEAFKQSLRLVEERLTNLRAHSRRALAGIKNAYHIGSNPSQTQDDIDAVKHALAILAKDMRESGIGALPVLETNSNGQTEVPTEAKLMEKAGKGVQIHFEKLKRAQESAAVVANLLSTDHRLQRP